MSIEIKSSKSAFTLVELLVVIAIIGILVALLLPAVQAARAAARRTQCQNNMKQIGLALMNYHSANGIFPPSSTWPTDNLIGNATTDQHGPNWVILALPFMEGQTIYDDFDLTVPIPDPINMNTRSTEIAGMLCPEDPFNVQQFMGSTSTQTGSKGTHHLGDNWARGNYAANGALGLMTFNNHGAESCGGESSIGWKNDSLRGVMGANTSIGIARITDGTSYTILAAELRAGLTSYDSRGVWALGGGPPSSLWGHGYFGNAPGPNTPIANADDVFACIDIIREYGGVIPFLEQGMPCDTAGKPNYQTAPRSTHNGGLFAVFCDGSVHFINDSVEIRKDGYNEGLLTQGFPLTSVWDRLNLSADSEVIDRSQY